MPYSLARPLLFALEPETAHRLSLSALDWAHRAGLAPMLRGAAPASPVEVMGIDFPSPVGLAAGLDKDAEHIEALGALGFGFLELGGVTPRAQPGNTKPRLFRVTEARGIINRLGFNSKGIEVFARNLRGARERGYRGIIGVNLGKNRDTPLAHVADDYITSLEHVYTLASFATLNISSPNTPDLRLLQEEEALHRLLGSLSAARARLADRHGRRLPLAVKIAPDMSDAQIKTIARLAVLHEMDAIIATNTTVARQAVQGLKNADEAGGLSGEPLRERSTEVIRTLAAVSGDALPIIGGGGIMSVADALEKLQAGAKLIQLYTGLVYRGPQLVGEIVRGVARARGSEGAAVQAHGSSAQASNRGDIARG